MSTPENTAYVQAHAARLAREMRSLDPETFRALDVERMRSLDPETFRAIAVEEFARLDPALAAQRQAENEKALSASLISAQRYVEAGNRRAAARHLRDAERITRRFPRSAGGGTR